MTIIRFDLTKTEREEEIVLTLEKVSFKHRGSFSEIFENTLIKILQFSLIVLVFH